MLVFLYSEQSLQEPIAISDNGLTILEFSHLIEDSAESPISFLFQRPHVWPLVFIYFLPLLLEYILLLVIYYVKKYHIKYFINRRIVYCSPTGWPL